MNCFLCLFCTSAISLRIYLYLKTKKMILLKLILNYFIFTFLNHFFSTLFSYLLFGLKNSIELNIQTFPLFAIKYCIISIVVAILLPVVLVLIEKNVDLWVEVELNNEIKKKDKKSI